MLGYDISWAAFNVIEVMSSPKFTHKVGRDVTTVEIYIREFFEFMLIDGPSGWVL